MPGQREKSGILSRSTKRTNDRQPEYRGECTINGVEYWISAWVKDGKDRDGNPRKFFSLAFESKVDADARKNAAGGSGGQASKPRASFERELNDEVPF